MIADFQSERMDEQRCALLPGWKRSDKSMPNPGNNQPQEASNDGKAEPDEPFFDMLMRCQGKI